MSTAAYTAKDITVLEGLEPVRRRPSMYIGGVDTKGLHHLVWEIIDNAVDEYLNGYADAVAVTLHKGGDAVTVGGYVQNRLGRIGRVGDVVPLGPAHALRVLETRQRRVLRVLSGPRERVLLTSPMNPVP